jgi:glycosyltransferase involved in cell wall biosynthesis
MATFNGERYVREQLDSILAELGDDDEVVVVDDGSSDATVAVVEGVGDRRIRLFPRRENRGYVRSFEEAIRRSEGEFILLADQDDVWIPGRVVELVAGLETSEVVASNMLILGGERPRWWMPGSQGRQWLRNLLRIVSGVSGYYGCGMGVKRTFMPVILPFPEFLVESHDLWVAIAGNLSHSISLVESPTLRRRVHDSNATPTRPRSLRKILSARVMLLRSILVLERRIRRFRRQAA